jgi:prepilin-type N-terminal cleavage/methylation domain-containing protein
MSNKIASRPTPGFTLVELLVVISIVALLISVLLPSLSQAKEVAIRTKCLASQRGIGVAMSAYASDNHDYFPSTCTENALNTNLADAQGIAGATSTGFRVARVGRLRNPLEPGQGGCLLVGDYIKFESLWCPGIVINSTTELNTMPYAQAKTAYYNYPNGGDVGLGYLFRIQAYYTGDGVFNGRRWLSPSRDNAMYKLPVVFDPVAYQNLAKPTEFRVSVHNLSGYSMLYGDGSTLFYSDPNYAQMLGYFNNVSYYWGTGWAGYINTYLDHTR